MSDDDTKTVWLVLSEYEGIVQSPMAIFSTEELATKAFPNLGENQWIEEEIVDDPFFLGRTDE